MLDVKAAGRCHSDVSYLDGTITSLLGHIPIVLGHETAGIVTAVGDGVDNFAIGAKVGISATVEGPGTAVDGGFAVKVLVEARLAVHIPDGVDFEQAAPAMDQPEPPTAPSRPSATSRKA